MRIIDILGHKGHGVVTIGPDATTQEAMRVMVRHGIGAVVVTDGAIRGILTERDLLRLGAEDPARLVSLRVGDAMTTGLVTAGPDEDIQRVMTLMTEHRIRHLPVVEDGELRGIVSIGDVVNAMRRHVESENQYLHAYIGGTVA